MESWMTKKKIARTPRTRSLLRDRRSYRPTDLNDSEIQKRADRSINISGDVWLDEYGEFCYEIENQQPNEVVVTTEDGERNEVVTDIVVEELEDFYEEYYVEGGGEEVVEEELVCAEVLEEEKEGETTDHVDVLQILRQRKNDPSGYERRVVQAQETLRELTERLSTLSYSVNEVTSLEFAQRFLIDAIELLEENLECKEKTSDNVDHEAFYVSFSDQNDSNKAITEMVNETNVSTVTSTSSVVKIEEPVYHNVPTCDN